ncbi:MAG: hypothetical protein LBS33_07525 [Streptococcaceae bacterium]|jgi:hypothetical protein|nr:hypothetical protein [Streptococcaceae bacterium]
MKITDEQKLFFKKLQQIQEFVVLTSLNDSNENVSESELNSVTYETIYRVMELIDGYMTDELTLDLQETSTNQSLKQGIELHDVCASFLRSE